MPNITNQNTVYLTTQSQEDSISLTNSRKVNEEYKQAQNVDIKVSKSTPGTKNGNLETTKFSNSANMTSEFKLAIMQSPSEYLNTTKQSTTFLSPQAQNAGELTMPSS